MKLKVVSDGSQEGAYLKQALECESIENTLKNSFEIIWGNSSQTSQKGIIFNSKNAIKNTLDKELVILFLRKSHIRCPRWLRPGKRTEFPILGRNYQHKNGTDIAIIDSLEEYRKSSSDYFIEYIKLIEEYRIHIMDTKVFFIEEKYKPGSFKIDNPNFDKKGLKIKLYKPEASLKAKRFFKMQRIDNMNLLQTFDEEETTDEPVIRTETFGWKLKQSTLFNKTKDERKLIFTLAKKAVYCLGLDFGVVSIGKDLNGRYYVLDVDATCTNWSELCRDAYVSEFKKLVSNYDNLIGQNREVTIGADPEFILKNTENNSLVFASDFFNSSGECGLDSRSIESGKRYFPLVEVRPEHSTDPLEVLQSLNTLLAEVGRIVHYKNVGLYAGSMPIDDYWVGGHIHFGTKVNSKLLRALDNYLAFPIMMIENVAPSRKRKLRYGDLGDYRVKSYGGFEYRTLSSWILNPQISAAVLCLAKVVIDEYLNLDKIFISDYSDIRAFYKVNKHYFKEKTLEIINIISNTKTFSNYAEQISPLFKMIKNGETWDENKNLKETWNIKSSSSVYKPILRCFVPRLKREEYGIALETTIPILIANNVFKLKVYPKDDFSLNKDNYITFSEDVNRKIGIAGSQGLSLWFDNEKNMFRVGPIIGIFSYVCDHPLGPFALQSAYFKKLIKFASNKGMLAYVFTIWETEWFNHRIKGYTYDFEKDQWIKKYFPAPDIIYDRGDVMNENNYGKRAIDYINYTSKYKIKFINSLECINLTNNKWETYMLLNRDSRTSNYQIDTIEFSDNDALKQFIEHYKHVFLKLKNGSRSKGIFSIEKLADTMYSIQYRNSLFENVSISTDESNLISIIKSEIEKLGCTNSDYIIQRGINLSKYYGRSFEIRVIMQKNGTGEWYRTSMIARSTGEDSKFLSLIDELDVKSSVVLSSCFGADAETIANKLRLAAKLIVQVLDEAKIEAGEIAIDFGIDTDSNIYVIELNSKPDNLLATIGAYRMRNLSMYRLLEYARFLASHNM